MAETHSGASADKRRTMKVERKSEKVGGEEETCCCSCELKGRGGVQNLAKPHLPKLPTGSRDSNQVSVTAARQNPFKLNRASPGDGDANQMAKFQVKGRASLGKTLRDFYFFKKRRAALCCFKASVFTLAWS